MRLSRELYGAITQTGVLYKSSDGGKNWTKILYINEKTGCADIQVDPKEPNRIYASMWQFRRTPWSFSSGGEGSGLLKVKITEDMETY